MDKEIKVLLDEEIKKEFSDLESLETGSKEKSAAVDDLVKLYKLKNEESEAKLGFEERIDTRTRDEELKEKQLAEQKKDRYFKLGIEIAGLVLPMTFYAVWMHKGLKFEETGSLTSSTFRGLWNHFRPTKK